MPWEPIDSRGLRLQTGDRVRVVGVPDLSPSPDPDELGTREVFEHLVGTYRRIAGFDELGHARLDFRIRQGPHSGLHTVWIEPYLLRRAHG
jgi:hypothetical protein